jgi:ankyrin repeat protein
MIHLVAVAAVLLLFRPPALAAQDLNAALMDAVQAGDAEKVQSLLKAGADPNKRGAEDPIPLILAAANGLTDIAHALVEAGANVNAKQGSGITALMFAATNNHPDIVSYLLDKGADANAKMDEELWTALMSAVSRGFLDVVRALLAKGAEANVKDEFGVTPLMMAALMHDTPVERTIDLQNDILKLLLAGGADVKAKNKNGLNVFMLATARGQFRRNPQMGEILKKAGGEPDPREEQLAEAAGSNQSETVGALLQEGVDPNAVDGHWVSALLRAVESGDLQIVKMLLDRGADVNMENISGDTALGVARVKRSAEVIELLTKAGAKE